MIAEIWKNLSVGSRVLVALALLSSLGVALWPVVPNEGKEFWIFARTHVPQYEPLIKRWNEQAREMGGPEIRLSLMTVGALQRRLISGFLSGTPVASLVEVERSMVPQVFSGPLDKVGLTDLTERIRAEGIDQEILAASFSPWTSRGRIFGLPHDVHPVALAYRADIIEAAGIDVTQAETWDEFFALLRPLMFDAEGNRIRFLLNYGITNTEATEAMILQAGGGYFDDMERLALATETNAAVLSQLVAWADGPEPVSMDAPEFSASGNKLRLDGFVLASLMPDWLSGVWKTDLPGLAGKVKLMPLPAWKRGGRRTSVWGGTMLGLPKADGDFETNWKIAKYLYLSPQTAEGMFRESGIISPVKANWSNPVYDVKDEFFSGQAIGRTFINLCEDVPRRTSSPFYLLARSRTMEALLALRKYARENEVFEPSQLLPKARELLHEAQESVEARMKRNVFLQTEETP